MSTAIKIENLSKHYIIGHKNNERYSALRDVIASGVTGIGRQVLDFARGRRGLSREITREEFWALKDVNLEIEQGERIGIIGRNGAGKSTLLKVLSRITEPTRGKVSIKGRVASLLEVGTGFHPELTGRENIFLNAAILGMSKADIKAKFDQIVDFAEIEKFLDTPVKRYSSGMYVRLAFSVAAHLEPEILIVDEVLAVGDSAFQEKCLGKMEEVGSEGRTVLFVSHNIGAIQKLCSKGILINKGQITRMGELDAVISHYMSLNNNNQNSLNISNLPRRNDLAKLARISGCKIIDKDGKSVTVLRYGEMFSIQIQFECLNSISNIRAVIGINSQLGNRITTLQSNMSLDLVLENTYVAKVAIKGFTLNPGSYNLTLGLRKGVEGIDHIENISQFTVSDVADQGVTIESDAIWYGYVQAQHQKWSMGALGKGQYE